MVRGRTWRTPRRLAGGALSEARAPKAVTLIELLVVLFVLTVLVALVVGVSRYTMQEAGRKQTVATQAILSRAIDAFTKAHDGSPPKEKLVPGTFSADQRAKARIQDLWDKLNEEAKTNEDVRRLLHELQTEATNRNDRTFLDGFGKHMDYREELGLGGRPVLISAGPDGDWNKTEEHIRSDGRGR